MIILDLLKFSFLWVVFHAFQLLRKVLFAFVPTSLIKKHFVDEFGPHYKIKVTTTEETPGEYDRSKYDCEIIVHDPRFFKRVALDDIMGLGESYMEGSWDCGNIPELLECLLKVPPGLPLILADQILLATNRQTKDLSFRVMEDHYNLGNDLYAAMLDPTMNYTCALWKDDTLTLEEAQINKMDLVARKLHLKPGMKVLELGCGFGATAKYLASHYGVSVVAYNISAEQVAYARNNCAGLDVTIHAEDYRNANGQYDAVCSIGLFEHVGHRQFREYFEVVERCLKPDGIALVHSIVVADHQTRTSRWLCKYIFPGGELPYAMDFLKASKNLLVVEDLHSFAKSYKTTLVEWHKNFNANWDMKLEPTYGNMMHGQFKRMWNFYLLFCIGTFEDRASQLMQVVYTKIGRKAEYRSVR